jgi:hypothetical protein
MANAASQYREYHQQTQCSALKVCIKHIALDACFSKMSRVQSPVLRVRNDAIYTLLTNL